MADSALSGLTAAGAYSDADLLYIVQGGVSYKTTWGALHAALTTIIEYPEVANYAALPAAASHSGEIYVVLASQGTGWLFTLKESGFYRSDGAAWTRLGALPSDYFTDSVLYIADDSDPTKVCKFQLSGITTGTTRTMTVPNASGTIMLVGDAPATHAASHTDGTDDIQSATASQKGLATAAQITKLDAITGANTGDQTLAGLKSLFHSRTAKTGAYTVLAADKGVLFDSTSGTFTYTLTAAATLGDAWYCAFFNSGSGVVTLDGNASETIRDATSSATTKTLAQGEGGILFCDGTGFFLFKIGASGGGSAAEKWSGAFDGGGVVLASGVIAYRRVYTTGTITKNSIVGNASGAVTLTVKRYTPSGGALGSATTLGTFALASTVEDTDTGLSWSVTAGDVLSIETGGTITTVTRINWDMSQ